MYDVLHSVKQCPKSCIISWSYINVQNIGS